MEEAEAALAVQTLTAFLSDICETDHIIVLDKFGRYVSMDVVLNNGAYVRFWYEKLRRLILSDPLTMDGTQFDPNKAYVFNDKEVVRKIIALARRNPSHIKFYPHPYNCDLIY